MQIQKREGQRRRPPFVTTLTQTLFPTHTYRYTGAYDGVFTMPTAAPPKGGWKITKSVSTMTHPSATTFPSSSGTTDTSTATHTTSSSSTNTSSFSSTSNSSSTTSNTSTATSTTAGPTVAPGMETATAGWETWDAGHRAGVVITVLIVLLGVTTGAFFWRQRLRRNAMIRGEGWEFGRKERPHFLEGSERINAIDGGGNDVVVKAVDLSGVVVEGLVNEEGCAGGSDGTGDGDGRGGGSGGGGSGGGAAVRAMRRTASAQERFRRDIFGGWKGRRDGGGGGGGIARSGTWHAGMRRGRGGRHYHIGVTTLLSRHSSLQIPRIPTPAEWDIIKVGANGAPLGSLGISESKRLTDGGSVSGVVRI